MKYNVKYESEIGTDDCVMEYDSEQEAESDIRKQLEVAKEYFEDNDFEYDYGHFGNKTEIWRPGRNEYASWERLWL